MALSTKSSSFGTVGSAAAVQLFAENGSRGRLVVQANHSNSGIIYIKWNGTTPTNTDHHFALSAGAAYYLDNASVPSGAVSVIGSAAGQAFVAEEG